MAVTVRLIQVSEWRLYKSLRLRALADAPDAFGSTLGQEALRTDAQWQERLSLAASSGKDLPLFAIVAEEPVGLAWAKVDAAHSDNIDLSQMWVAPESRRHGAASQLLERVIQWVRDKGAARVSLGVTCGDSPAVRLYTKFGFIASGSSEALREGSSLQAQSMHLSLRRGASKPLV